MSKAKGAAKAGPASQPRTLERGHGQNVQLEEEAMLGAHSTSLNNSSSAFGYRREISS